MIKDILRGIIGTFIFSLLVLTLMGIINISKEVKNMVDEKFNNDIKFDPLITGVKDNHIVYSTANETYDIFNIIDNHTSKSITYQEVTKDNILINTSNYSLSIKDGLYGIRRNYRTYSTTVVEPNYDEIKPYFDYPKIKEPYLVVTKDNSKAIIDINENIIIDNLEPEISIISFNG